MRRLVAALVLLTLVLSLVSLRPTSAQDPTYEDLATRVAVLETAVAELRGSSSDSSASASPAPGSSAEAFSEDDQIYAVTVEMLINQTEYLVDKTSTWLGEFTPSDTLSEIASVDFVLLTRLTTPDHPTEMFSEIDATLDGALINLSTSSQGFIPFPSDSELSSRKAAFNAAVTAFRSAAEEFRVIVANKPGIASQPESGLHTLRGTLTLYDLDGGNFLPEYCWGEGGFDDLQIGANVVVKDGAGETIAIGRVDHSFGIGNTCVFTFAVNDVPDSKFYTAEIGNREGPSYSSADMEEANWILELSIGS